MSAPATTVVIISGVSGSGKSVALKTLEDVGFYCVDNLPAELLPAFIDALTRREQPIHQLGIGIDTRSHSDLVRMPEWLSALGAMGLAPKLVFFDADDAVLIRRYADTRRRHPLTTPALPLAEAITLERRMLRPLHALAEVNIDTSSLNIHQLRRALMGELGLAQGHALSLLFQSFAYRHGVPGDADFVFDARGLPNPHWEPALRPLSGRDAAVAEYFRQQPCSAEFVAQVGGLLDTWLPRLQSDTRSYVTVAIGCAGGRHRSVYLTETLAARARERGWGDVAVLHRELG